MTSPQTHEEWIEIALRRQQLLTEFVHHYEAGRIVLAKNMDESWQQTVGFLIRSCFEAVDSSPFVPDTACLEQEAEDRREMTRDLMARLRAGYSGNTP